MFSSGNAEFDAGDAQGGDDVVAEFVEQSVCVVGGDAVGDELDDGIVG